jgi:hypothetical protein
MREFPKSLILRNLPLGVDGKRGKISLANPTACGGAPLKRGLFQFAFKPLFF